VGLRRAGVRVSARDGYSRYKGFDYDGGERALTPRSEHECACGEELEYPNDRHPTSLTCSGCGVEWSVEAEGGYGETGSGWEWWLTEEVARG